MELDRIYGDTFIVTITGMGPVTFMIMRCSSCRHLLPIALHMGGRHCAVEGCRGRYKGPYG